MHNGEKSISCTKCIDTDFSLKLLAFTLAEVLITLGIIGVVAAVTMPTLTAEYQKKQTVIKLKKVYSELNQAVRISEAKYGTLETWDFEDFASPDDRVQYFSDKYLFPNIKVIEKCVPVSSSKCWDDKVYSPNGREKYSASNGLNGHSSFIASSGYSVYYWVGAAGNGAVFFVDLNGKKKPNTFGKDVFQFMMFWGDANSDGVKLGLWPNGLTSVSSSVSRDGLMVNCNKNSNSPNAGELCAAVIMLDGWEIKDDYPW